LVFFDEGWQLEFFVLSSAQFKFNYYFIIIIFFRNFCQVTPRTMH
jgi:hypothetical protein